MSVSFKRNIYKHYNKFVVSKVIKGEQITYKSCDSLEEAINYRDRLIANDWKPLPKTPEEILAEESFNYFKRLQMNNNKNAYKIVNVKSKYLGSVKNIEEALFYRDLYSDCPDGNVPKPNEVDLITDNPYLEEGLRYSIPERLQKKERDSKYGKGRIEKKGPSSYHIYHGSTNDHKHKYICACRTYEHAYYVRQELQKCDWDLTQLSRIFDEYPKWYTWLMKFYQYIGVNHQSHGEGAKYTITVPTEYADTNSMERYYYGRLEDALFERDYLISHGWDYESLCYCIDDTNNPYDDMELPPYPERKTRNITFKNFDDELRKITEYILDGVTNQKECASLLGIRSATIRNWMKRYNTTWNDFKEIVLSGEDPLSVLEFNERIIQPDLSPSKPPNFNGYIHKGSKRSPYVVSRKNVYYGAYKDKKTAKKVIHELEKVNWDKSYLKQIQEKIGHEDFLGSKKWIYENTGGYGYSIRKKNKDRKMINYGSYKDRRVAEVVRDLLILCDWDKSKYPIIRAWVEYAFNRNIINWNGGSVK